jgi:hypothetical protein
MSFDYDALDAPPTTAVQQTQSTHWVDGSVWRIFQLVVPVAHLPILYTRNQMVSGGDLKTYDIGQLHVATEGCADTSDHGYLEVEYDVELIDKQVGGSSNVAQSGYSVNLSSNFSLSSATAVIQFDEEVVNGLEATNSSGVITVPAGNYLVIATLTIVTGNLSSSRFLVNGAAASPPMGVGLISTTDPSMTSHFVVNLPASGTIAVEGTGAANCSAVGDSCRLSIIPF